MKDFQAGEKLYASQLNEIVDAIRKNQRGVQQLYMENYFDSKNTPYSSLLYDGFFDELKKNLASGEVMTGKSVGNKIIEVASQAELDTFSVGDKVQIYDGSNQEVHEIAGLEVVQDAVIDDADFSEASTTAEASGYFSDSQQATERRTGWTGNTCNKTSWRKYTYSFSSVAGVTYTIRFKVISVYIWNNGYVPIYVDVDSTNKYSGTHSSETEVSVDVTGTGATMTIDLRWQESYNVNSWVGGNDGYLKDFIVFSSSYQITTVDDLTNTYSSGYVKACTGDFDTANKQYLCLAGVGDLKKVVYALPLTTFEQLMNTVNLWLIRKVTVSQNLVSGISQGATSATITDSSGTIVTGDIIELKSSDLSVRERKTVTGVTVDGGNLIISFTGDPVVNSGGFTTSDFLERVDALPQVSLTTSGSDWVEPTFVRAVELVVDGATYTEDLFTYRPSSSANMLRVFIELTRGDTALTPALKRIGCALSGEE